MLPIIWRAPHICDNVRANAVEVPMSRLTIDMTDQQHQSLKAMAALQGKTIKQYALERLFPQQKSDADDAWQELRQLLNARFEEGLAGKVSPLSAAQIIEQELGPDWRD
jgi:hypothetical protein